MRELLEVFGDERLIRLRKILVRDIAGLRLVLQQAFESGDDAVQSHRSFHCLLACETEIALPHSLASRSHFRCGLAGIISSVMTQSRVPACHPLQLFRQTPGFLAQPILVLGHFLCAGR